MKKFFIYTFIIGFLLIFYLNRIEITNFTFKKIANSMSKDSDIVSEYVTNRNLPNIKKMDSLYVSNINDIYNAIYTVIDNGWNNKYLFCDLEYYDCINDLNNLTGNDIYIEFINNIVHPYNSFNNIKIITYELGFAKIEVVRNYTDNEIVNINKEIKNIENKIIKNNMSIKDKIKTFHDYIIDNTKYDVEESIILEKNPFSDVTSNKASKVLFDNIGLCGGYTDTLSIYLHTLGLINYKISSNSHIWNYTIINNVGYHIDMTWDDPVISTGEEIIDDTYLLITTDELYKLDNITHEFDRVLYNA
ncbi:MAG: hypothetical protein IJZ36_03120 [Bacilli bacterium]|nr:hypothetical protein [Bacilli bacterium]